LLIVFKKNIESVSTCWNFKSVKPKGPITILCVTVELQSNNFKRIKFFWVENKNKKIVF
jgi:hypothetical protein